jgi:cytochrome c oxidase subunit 2
MFTDASNFVQGVDTVFAIIVGISLFFLIALTALMIYFVIRYNRKRHPKSIYVKDNPWLETAWIVIPLIIVLYMFYIGWEGFLPMRVVPDDAMEVKAIGKMWAFEFEYEGEKVSDTLMLPINKSVKIDLISTDVLHGFSVPAFRIKEDMVPVKDNYTWFKPGELGEFDLYCTVYCGLSHSYMRSIVKVVPEEEFAQWVKNLPKRVNNEGNKGYKVLENNGCFACHSVDGSKLVGPSFKGTYGKKVKVKTNGAVREVLFDDKYLETSIYDPNADISGDYPQGLMKSYKNEITKEELVLVIDYLENLK